MKSKAKRMMNAVKNGYNAFISHFKAILRLLTLLVVLCVHFGIERLKWGLK
jgi:hypothetical protein